MMPFDTLDTNEKAEQFRKDRLKKINNEEVWSPMSDGPYCVLHWIPISEKLLFSLDKLKSMEFSKFVRMERGGCIKKTNADSVGFCSTERDKVLKVAGFPQEHNGRHFWNAQVFHSGALEMAFALSFWVDSKGIKRIPKKLLTRNLWNVMNGFRKCMLSFNVTAPIMVGVSLLRVSNYRFSVDSHTEFVAAIPGSHISSDSDQVILRGERIEKAQDIGEIERTIFDMLWMSFGYEECEYYGHNGKRKNWAIEVINSDSNNIATWLNRGGAWFEKGEYNEAIAYYNEIIQLEPNVAESWSNRGASQNKIGNFSKAIADCSEAIRLRPDYAAAWSNRGSAWTEMGEYEKAISDLDEAILLEPNLAIAWNNRGYAWIERGEYDKAVADLNESIRLKPDDEKTWNNLGIAWSDKGEYDKAISSLSEAIRFNPNLANAWNNRGYAWYQKKKYDNAIKDFEQAIRLSPDYTVAINNLNDAKEAFEKNKEDQQSYDGSKKPSESGMYESISAGLNTIQNATPSAEYFEWNFDNQKIRTASVPINNIALWENGLERLRDEILDIKNNDKLSNTHAALIPEVEKLESKLEQYKNSPQRIHDEIEIVFSSVQWLEKEQEIANDIHTQRFKRVLMDCVLDIRGNVPKVKEAAEKRNNLRLAQLSDYEQDTLSYITEKVIPYIEEEHIKQDMKQDIEAFKDNQNAVVSQEKTSRIYRWASRFSRILPFVMKYVPNFLKSVAGLIEAVKTILRLFGIGD